MNKMKVRKPMEEGERIDQGEKGNSSKDPTPIKKKNKVHNLEFRTHQRGFTK